MADLMKTIQLPDGKLYAVVPTLPCLRLPVFEPSDWWLRSANEPTAPAFKQIEFRWCGKRTANGTELWEQV